MRMVMNGVHSGTARAALKNENSDYYPVALTHEALRPGVIYADPYGHTLILVRQIQQTKKSPGILLSVDAQWMVLLQLNVSGKVTSCLIQTRRK